VKAPAGGLTALESLFLRIESPRTPMHMMTIAVFEGAPLTGPDGRLRIGELRAHTDARLHLVPRLRQRVHSAPFGLLAPVWEDDPAFDIARHLRQAAVPPPGSRRELLALCAELVSWPLDREHPLWELWFVEGLHGGRVAVVEKLHHAVADGLAGVELASVLLDLERHAPEPTAEPWRPEVPARFPSLRFDVGRAGAMVGDMVRGALTTARHPGRAWQRATTVAEGAASLFGPGVVAPRHTVNAPVGLHRRLAVVQEPLAELRRVERVTGATVNDQLLAAVAGGVRQWLERRGEQTAGRTLQVLVPVGFEHGGTGGLGNHVAGMLVRLPLDQDDAARLLAEVSVALRRRKALHQADAAGLLVESLELAPQPLLEAAAHVVHHQPFINLVVTNVPGPQVPLYSMGARMLEAFPFVPVAGNLAVGVAAFSYAGHLGVGIVGDRDAVPDLDVLTGAISATFRAIRRLAPAAEPAPNGRRHADAPARRRRRPAEPASGPRPVQSGECAAPVSPAPSAPVSLP
jgi:WS/DGAT/MGAT family acyltransferase